MKIRYGSTWLAPGGVELTSGYSINGSQVNDTVQYYRAAQASLRPRGLRSEQISFSVNRLFNSSREAERFVASHFAELSQQQDLYLFCGPDADQEIVLYEDAVLDNVARSFSGTNVLLTYTFSAGAATFDTPPPTVTEPDASMIKRGATAISNGASSLAVVFSVPFSGTPVVVPCVQIPSGGDFIFATVRDGTVSASGFTADLSGAVPNANYKLSWIASA